MIVTILIIGVNLVSVTIISANAQNNGFRLEQIQHMMGPRPHHNMMENRMHRSNSYSFSTIKGNNTIDNKNSIYVSKVLGATSRTTNAYQPNPVYIKGGQRIIWTNNASI
jgi:ABC-type lipoprotein release transport system permease subunit